jgi:hypothetical protein
MKNLKLVIPVFILLASSCTPDIGVPVVEKGEADFTRTVAIGGSFMAGYQDGALFEDGQKKSISALIATQLRLAGGEEFGQALISGTASLGISSKPWEGTFVTRSQLGYKADCNGVEGISPLKSFLDNSAVNLLQQRISVSVNNFSVPFARIKDLFSPSLGISLSQGNNNPYYYRFASSPGISTAVDDAFAKNPTFMLLWLGMEDIYEYARNGGYGVSLTSYTEFEAYLDSILSKAYMLGIKGAIANIPDFENFPYYTTIPYNKAELTKNKADSLNNLYETGGFDHIHFTEGQNAFVILDQNHPKGFRQMEQGEYILLTAPLDSMRCNFYGLIVNVIHDRYVLDKNEVTIIRNRIGSYNSIISRLANQYNFAIVNMRDYLKEVKTGVRVNGVDFNSSFVSGGFYSLDGYHPTQKGYAYIANKFIKNINAKYKSYIPTTPCLECEGVRFP